MNTVEITKRFWEVMNEFNEDMDEKIWKDTVMEAMNSSSYSMSNLDEIYRNGVPEKGLECFFGDDFGIVVVGYSLLMRYGLELSEYNRWCNKVEEKYRYLLYRLIGKNDAYLKQLYYTDKLKPIMTFFENNEKKQFTLSDSKDGLFTLYGNTLNFNEKVKDIIQYYKFRETLKEEMGRMFSKQYSRMIHKFDDCADYLININNDINEVAISRLKEYIKDMEHSQESVDEAVKNYIKSRNAYTPYKFFIEVFADIAEEYVGDVYKNEIRNMKRESIEFVGGGFGIGGMIAGSVQAAVTNMAYQKFVSYLSGFDERRVLYKINAKKYQIFSSPEFLDEMKDIVETNIEILCDCVLYSISLGENTALSGMNEYHRRINILYNSTPYLKKEDLYNVAITILQVYPFEPDSYKFAYDTVGDNENELEIFASVFGVKEFLDYKIEKEPDDLTDDLHEKIKNRVSFGYEEIKKKELQMLSVNKQINIISSYIDRQELDCLEMQDKMIQLFYIMEECGFSKGSKWISISPTQFYIQRKLNVIFKKISIMPCNYNNPNVTNFFDYILLEELFQCCDKFQNIEHLDDCTKDEVQSGIDLINKYTIHKPDSWSDIIRYENWISDEMSSLLKTLMTMFGKLIKSFEETEKKQLEEEEKRRKEKEREENFKKYIVLYQKKNSDSTDFYKSYEFRNRFKSVMDRKTNEQYILRYDFDVEDIDKRKAIEDIEQGFGGEYILWYDAYSDILLTDHNLYVSKEKISLWRIKEMILIETISPKSKYWAVIETLDGRIPILEHVRISFDFIHAFNAAIYTFQKGNIQYDKGKVFYCSQCNSFDVQKKIFRYECLNCGNYNEEKIGVYKIGNLKETIVNYKSFANRYIYKSEETFLQWCKELFPEMLNIEPKQGVKQEQKIIPVDWREKKVAKEDSEIFYKRFQDAIISTDIKQYSVNEPIDQLTDKKLYERMAYMREKQPRQIVLYSNGDVIITDCFIIWGKLVEGIDDIAEISWSNNQENGASKILLIMKNGLKYSIKEEGQSPIIAAVINTALGLNKENSGNIVEDQKPKEMFCTSCGKKILRSSKFCTFCGAKNNYEG